MNFHYSRVRIKILKDRFAASGRPSRRGHRLSEAVKPMKVLQKRTQLRRQRNGVPSGV